MCPTQTQRVSRVPSSGGGAASGPWRGSPMPHPPLGGPPNSAPTRRRRRWLSPLRSRPGEGQAGSPRAEGASRGRGVGGGEANATEAGESSRRPAVERRCPTHRTGRAEQQCAASALVLRVDATERAGLLARGVPRLKQKHVVCGTDGGGHATACHHTMRLQCTWTPYTQTRAMREVRVAALAAKPGWP